MSFLHSVFLGIIQGITEFLPVSSSGHLAILRNLLGIETTGGILFDVLLHLGTAVAILLALRKDVRLILLEFAGIVGDILKNLYIFLQNKRTKKGQAYNRLICNNTRKLMALIVVSTIPTAILGFFSRRLVELAGNTLLFPGIGLLLTGILLIVVDKIPNGEKIPREISFADAMWLGICQGIAVFPGLSRSGITICVGLLCGMNKRLAVKYSFLMAVPAIFGAMLLELPEVFGGEVAGMSLFIYLCGGVAAALTGYFCIRGMLKLVHKKKLRYFSYYCFAAGVIAAASNFLL